VTSSGFSSPRVPSISILIVMLIAAGLVAIADGAARGRFFGASRNNTDDSGPKRTYYQPQELQRVRPTENALPAAEPKADRKGTSSSGKTQPASLSGSEPDSGGCLSLGDPLAAGKVALMTEEISSAIRSRQISAEFARWEGYTAGRLNASAGKYTGQELSGNCRLKWYDRLMRTPTNAPADAEQFTRHLHQAVLGGAEGLATVLRIAREKLDLQARDCPPTKQPATSVEALELLQQVLCTVHAGYQAAIAPLSKPEVDELANRAYSVFVGTNQVGHTLDDRASARRLCDLIEKMDRGAMLAAAEDLLPLLSEVFRRKIEELPDEGDVKVPGVSGRVLKTIDTVAGAIVIGGRANNTYRLDEMAGVAAVVDLGGDDEYIEGTVSRQRPILVIIDVKGNDVYRGKLPGIQGGAILGVSLLLDWHGNDIYEAGDVAQASAIAGVGILVDQGGSDVYTGRRRVQSHALGGLGILIDRGGDDQYCCTMWGQGFGGPLGFALLDDVRGNDHYFAGGAYADSYPETPGLEGWGQGVGAGIRQVANGGIGVLLDGSGDDVYEFDYLSHGGGYWFGSGFLRDFAGNDKHLGSTEKAYGGGKRSQPEYQRFGNGWGCHFAMGFLFDDAGDDVYRGWIMGTGFGWDCSIGVLADFCGNDRYEANGSMLQGNGAQASMGVLFDYGGNDTYTSQSQAYAAPGISYHPLPDCGGNFSFVIDYGGKDDYGCKASNNAITQRGWAGGFLIDRPRAGEIADTSKQSSQETSPSKVTAGRLQESITSRLNAIRVSAAE
jgi:hypothetical protein